MMKHDLSCWPLVLSVGRGRPSLAELHDYATAWNAWLERGQRFAMLRILLDSQAHGYPPGGAGIRKAWFGANRQRFESQVAGMASVAPGDVLARIDRLASQQPLTVPARAFAEADAAIAWLLPLLAPGRRDNALETRALRHCRELLASIADAT